MSSVWLPRRANHKNSLSNSKAPVFGIFLMHPSAIARLIPRPITPAFVAEAELPHCSEVRRAAARFDGHTEPRIR
jgi:hypothetical protein